MRSITLIVLLAATPVYRVQAIGTEGDGSALAVNEEGDVAGEFGGAAFVWRNGRLRTFEPIFPCSMSGLQLMTAAVYDAKMHLLRTDGQCSYEIDGINDSGTLVGVDGYGGFVRYANGTQIEVQPLSHRPEWNGTRASAINNEGRVVGARRSTSVRSIKCSAHARPGCAAGISEHIRDRDR